MAETPQRRRRALPAHPMSSMSPENFHMNGSPRGMYNPTQMDCTPEQKQKYSKVLTNPSAATAESGEAASAFDTNLLRQYNVQNLAAGQKFVDLVQTFFAYGNSEIQEAVNMLANGMQNMLREYHANYQDLAAVRAENFTLQQTCAEMRRASETLMEAEGTIAVLQEQLKASEQRFESLSEHLTRVEQEKSTLETQLESANQGIVRLNKNQEINSANARHLKAGLEFFTDPSTRCTFKFPVMQMNGHLMDLHRIISTWSKTASESDTHPFRSYICPLSKTPTTLAPLKVTSRLHTHAISLGVQLSSPVYFEFNKDGQWACFNPKNQYYLIAQICFIQANLQFDRFSSDTIVLDEGSTFIHFQLSKVRFRPFNHANILIFFGRFSLDTPYRFVRRTRRTTRNPPCACGSTSPTRGTRSPTSPSNLETTEPCGRSSSGRRTSRASG